MGADVFVWQVCAHTGLLPSDDEEIVNFCYNAGCDVVRKFAGELLTDIPQGKHINQGHLFTRLGFTCVS